MVDRLLFSVVIVTDRILVTIQREADLCFIDLRAEVVRILKRLVRAFSVLWIFQFDLSRNTKAIPQVALLFGELFRRAERDDLPGLRLFSERATKNNLLIALA